MNATMLMRIAKVIALVGFVLPWVTVSCSGTRLATASGLDLALGHLTVHNPVNGAVQPNQHGSPDIWIVLALVAALVALGIGFVRGGLRISLAAIVASFVCAVIGVATLHDTLVKGAAKAGRSELPGADGQNFDAQAAALIQVNTQFGYWVTILALLLAGLIGVMVVTGRGGAFERLLAKPAAPPPPRNPAD